MDTDSNKELVRRYYEQVVSTGNVSRIAEFIASDYAEVHDNVRHQLGLEGARQHVLGVRRTYPDLQLTIEQQIAEGPWVVSCVTMRGTHRGEWLGIAPTGRAVQLTAVNVDRVLDGRIVEHGGAANLLGPMLEIGRGARRRADAPRGLIAALESQQRAIRTKRWSKSLPTVFPFRGYVLPVHPQRTLPSGGLIAEHRRIHQIPLDRSPRAALRSSAPSLSNRLTDEATEPAPSFR